MENNTSGHGKFAEVPANVNKWNWGAFWLTWIWGIFNKSYIALLSLLPILNFIMPFYLGFKGNELAWRNNEWYDVEELHKTQKKWSIAGWIFALIVIACIAGNEIIKYNELKESERIKNEILYILNNNKKVEEFIGKDYDIITQGYTMEIKNQYKASGFVLKSSKGIFFLRCELNRNNKIESIRISMPNDNKNKKSKSMDIYP
ncbi:hypothetical protein CLTEP_04670 [Clostridium tepidiprofundi DSM 19306]|uniref:Uncharacterized protein n=1 Tax=Clostridium tepidiprofundi DSM 19306 TaxID=1121338 RepID=A0A151B6H2_9CLOT|nr:hypothetical protein [Clostridium tepidiprofundi]KYH35528.1 hypothetical protein CLTEP_04670 [Clostridium tepidiprofundi DSM 19306]